MKQIQLTQGKFAQIDDEDFEKVNQHKWRYNEGYAHNRKIGYMHRFIVNAAKDKFVDHIDHNKLNNQKSNLRLCSKSQNLMNMNKHKGSSKFKGVCKATINSYTYWQALIMKNRKRISLRYFPFTEHGELQAAMTYDAKAIELFGEFALTNKMLGLY